MLIGVYELPSSGDHVKVIAHRYTDVNGRKVDAQTVEGVLEWLDGNGGWVKGAEKSRWIPLEEFRHHHEDGRQREKPDSE